MSNENEGPRTKKIKLQENATSDISGEPDEFKTFKQFFFRLNTFYTFLLCRKHIIPTFDTLSTQIKTAIKRDVTELDFAKVVVIMPRDCMFKYVDENQFNHEKLNFDFNNGGYEMKDNDIFELKALDSEYNSQNRPTQILIFEFTDGVLKRSWKTDGPLTNVRLPNITVEEMKKMISKRKVNFEEALQRFIDTHDDPYKTLLSEARKIIPQKKEYTDPIEQMLKAKESLDDPDLENLDGETISMGNMIQKLKRMEHYNSQIKDHLIIPAKMAEFKSLNFEISPQALQALEYTSFYTHQADAINAVHSGQNVIITTSTSSGKSLIYQLAAIDFLLKDPESTFMYIFPTKALAQDQKRAFQALLRKIPGLNHIVADTYDGDTEVEQRRFVRKNARVIFTNPDMIHASILPGHPNWKHFLYNLKLVVVDELHTYKGLFGSHVAFVMRRLIRLCREYYNNFSIQFVSCSATLKKPIEHMKEIFGIDDVVLIHEDGSPRGNKHMVIWNPPTLAQHLRKRESFIKASAIILVQLMLNNVRTIAFCYVRRVCELLMRDVINILEEMGRTDLLHDVMAYRGGYSAEDRRKIEREMFHGNLRAVISTNALELGIDIGTLDTVLMCGFPMSLANFHQQSGRAGRRNNDSMTIVVASDSPVDQHYVAHPQLLLEHENSEMYQELVLDLDNQLILEGHIQCAAFELPIILDRDTKYFNDEFLTKLCTQKLQDSPEGYHTSNKFLPWPSKLVSLRGVEEDQFAVVDLTNGRNTVIEEIETSRTSFTLYDGAIFIHQGYPYLVKEFNPDERYATVQRVDVDWVTSQRDFTDVDPQVAEIVRSIKGSDIPIYFGQIQTTIIVFGYFKVDKLKRIIDAVETHNPPVIINSKGFWIDIPSQAVDLCKEKNLSLAGAIHAAEHAIIGLLPRFIVAGVEEIQTECKAPEKEFATRQTARIRPARLIFSDSRGGKYGSGLSIKAFENIDEILRGALERIEECPCESGCPDCVAASFCKENSLVLSKPGALLLLHVILGHESATFIDKITEGPEPNMPEVKVETVVPVSGHVKFSPNIKVIDVREES